MPYYALFDSVSGVLKSHGTSPPPATPHGHTSKDVVSDPGDGIWNPVTRVFDPRPSESITLLAAIRLDPDYISFTAANRTKVENIVSRVLALKLGITPASHMVPK